MDELATADWWDTPFADAEEATSLPGESVASCTSSAVVSHDSTTPGERKSASLLGLALASMTLKRRRKEN
jgi:hypothetical protein